MKNKNMELNNIFTIGGLDPTGGAGVLLDAAAARAAGAHSAAIVTTLTIQNGERFTASKIIQAGHIETTLRTLIETMSFKAAKTGALCNGSIVKVVAKQLKRLPFLPVIVDPVILSTSGGTLLNADGVRMLKKHLLPMCAMVTPNLPEVNVLFGLDCKTVHQMERAARQIVKLGINAVLIKGGHLRSKQLADVYADSCGGEQVFWRTRRNNTEIRGTGCALASLIASFVARGHNLSNAVSKAEQVLSDAINKAYRIGQGPFLLGF